MTERKCFNPPIDHATIAKTIKERNLGDIFTVGLLGNTKFADTDFERINSLFRITIPRSNGCDNLLAGPDFLLSVGEQILTVYKDTSRNLGLFKLINEQIQTVLNKYPQAYPLLMNQLAAKIPESLRGEIGYMPAAVTHQLPIVINIIDGIPSSVLKALWRLTNDPNENLN